MKDVDRDLASLLVMNNSHGSYLLRESKKFNKTVLLSLNYYGNVRHISLSVTNDGFCCFGTDDEDTHYFKSVENFIDYLTTYPLYLIDDKEPSMVTLDGVWKAQNFSTKKVSFLNISAETPKGVVSTPKIGGYTG